MKTKKIAVIGAGIFGTSAALELSKHGDITVFEKAEEILSGASTSNHLRHHCGYHYPRSRKTAMESRAGHASFEKEYGGCVIAGFPAYYGVSKQGSSTSPHQFLKFCDSLKMPYEQAWPKEEFMDRSKIALCLKVPEAVYDPDRLRALVWKKLKNSSVKLKLAHEAIGGRFFGAAKVLKIKSEEGLKEEAFDVVVNATYCRFNDVCSWFGLPKRENLYEVMELLELDLPIEKVGLTIMDGGFSSLLPRAGRGVFTLGHVKASVLKDVVSDDLKPDMIAAQGMPSNRKEILERGAFDFPIVTRARVVRSIFITRMVKAASENTDERPSEIKDFGGGIYSIFAGKVITCVETARELSRLMMKL
ncbi:MAG: FAD-dependent oxidoreductase [Elusimicrobiota bacterium]